MSTKSILLNLLAFGLLLITLNSHGESLKLGNTYFWWAIQFLVLLVVWLIKRNLVSTQHKKLLGILALYSLYVSIQFIRGAFIADGYWDWKALLSNTMCLLIPLVAYLAYSKTLLTYLIKYYIFFTAPLFLVFQFFIGKDEFGFYLAPFSFLLLFIPIVSHKWKVLLLIIALYVIFADFGARSNVLKFSLPILFSLLYYFRSFIHLKLVEIFRKLLIALPLLFFVLAVTGSFNIFKPETVNQNALIVKKKDNDGKMVKENLGADTRTFLYVEVLATAQRYNTWIFGRSPARGNVSTWFGNADMNGRGERNGNEVAILNYFTWLGAIGVLFMFIIFYRASYLAVNQSNNTFSKLIGLFIAFRWAYAWVEDINNFYIQHIYLWIFIGFCYSKAFRNMSNIEMKQWIREIFALKIKSKPELPA
jgi:hypothetical protein